MDSSALNALTSYLDQVRVEEKCFYDGLNLTGRFYLLLEDHRKLLINQSKVFNSVTILSFRLAEVAQLSSQLLTFQSLVLPTSLLFFTMAK